MINKNLHQKNSITNPVKKFDWNKVQFEMKNKLGNDIYESWLKKISFVEDFEHYILVSVSTRFVRDWITSRYLDQILSIVKNYKKDINRIEIVINEEKDKKLYLSTSREDSKIETNVSFIKDSHLQYNRIDPNKKLENFILGPSNKLAFEASLKITEGKTHYNPLTLRMIPEQFKAPPEISFNTSLISKPLYEDVIHKASLNVHIDLNTMIF